MRQRQLAIISKSPIFLNTLFESFVICDKEGFTTSLAQHFLVIEVFNYLQEMLEFTLFVKIVVNA